VQRIAQQRKTKHINTELPGQELQANPATGAPCTWSDGIYVLPPLRYSLKRWMAPFDFLKRWMAPFDLPHLTVGHLASAGVGAAGFRSNETCRATR
jgi:hypothetical protein